MSKIVCVVPTVRPECHAAFVKAWTPLFGKHSVELITVWDGDDPHLEFRNFKRRYDGIIGEVVPKPVWSDLKAYGNADLVCRRTDACRNFGFMAAAQLNPDYVLTLDDDVVPLDTDDPIQAHIDALNCRVPLSWMNTAHDTDLYLRGVPYNVRDESPVMLSHGVWVGTPDFDGETQLRLESGNGVPYSLPYYVGPVPRGVLFPLCGMNVMVRREALPHLYYAPMGNDSGVPDLHRFADIFMGIVAKREFDHNNWAMVTGYSTVLHTRASDAQKNFENEKLGREWLEELWKTGRGPHRKGESPMGDYLASYAAKRNRYQRLIESILGGGKV